MSTKRLNLLVGQAVISDEFRTRLLNGQRATLLAEWQLEATEVASVMAIRAETLEDFAQGICQILEQPRPEAVVPDGFF